MRTLTVFLLICGTGLLAGQSLSRTEIAKLNADAYRIYSRNFAAADSLFRAAAETAARNDWPAEAAGATLHRGVVNYLAGNYREALALYQSALATFEILNDEAGQAAVLVEMGNFFLKRKETGRAREMLIRAEALAAAGGDERLRSNALDIRGRLEQNSGDKSAARELYERVLAIRRNIRDTVGLSYVYDHLASLDVEAGNYTRALTYLDSTVAIREALGDHQGWAVAVNNQGEAMLAAGDTVAALAYLERSLEVSTAVGFTDLRQWTMNLLAEAYAATNDPARAWALQQQVQLLKDSLYNTASARQVAEMQERFEAGRREQELELQRARLQRRTAWLVAAVAGVLMLLTLLFVLTRHLRQRQKMLRQEAENQLRIDRLRISRDLHDNLGAELSIVASSLDRMDRTLPGQPLQPVTKQVRYAMEQMRETIWAVRLEDANWASLFARLRTFAAKLPHPGIKLSLTTDLEGEPLDPQRVLNLYRFSQEALANAVRHARAENILVTADRKELRIEDDGIGFDPAASASGYGLSSLRERAAELNAELEIDSRNGRGTHVVLRFRPSDT